MSLNSTNRFKNLSSQYISEKYSGIETDYDKYTRILKEENELEEAESFLESVQLSDDHKSILESASDICSIDNNMIVSFIESSFIIEMENNMQVIKESKESAKAKQDLKNNSKVLVDQTTVSIINAGKDLLIKVKNLFESDKKIYDKYIVALSKPDALEGFKGISKIIFPKKDIMENIDNVINIDELKNLYMSFLKDINRCDEEEDIDAVVEKYRDDIDDIISKYNNIENELIEEKTDWIPDKSEIKTICTFINGNSIQKAISRNTKSVVDMISKLERDAKNSYLSMDSSNSDSVELRKAREKYDAISMLMKIIIKRYNKYKDITVREIASLRKAFIICGKYANYRLRTSHPLNENDQYLNEVLLSDSSDIYIYSLFT